MTVATISWETSAHRACGWTPGLFCSILSLAPRAFLLPCLRLSTLFTFPTMAEGIANVFLSVTILALDAQLKKQLKKQLQAAVPPALSRGCYRSKQRLRAEAARQ